MWHVSTATSAADSIGGKVCYSVLFNVS
jgi:hypothetical protein